MSKNSSQELFSRLLQEKHDQLISHSRELINDLVGENIEQKQISAQKTLTSAINLHGILSKSDVPPWLSNIINSLTSFVKNQWKTTDLIANFLPLKTSLEQHSWNFGTSSEPIFDFDAIFEHYKQQSQLPQLFDEIIRLLSEIESSGEIDSITMLNALKKVIATTKSGKDGSYFSLHASWNFLFEFLTNYAWAELSKIPGLGTALEALKKTIDNTEMEMHTVHAQVQTEIVKKAESEIKGLQGKTKFNYLTYDRSPFSPPSLHHTDSLNSSKANSQIPISSMPLIANS